jgi:hypothetical protein
MLYVSPVVEALRARPRLVLWTAALAQGAIWTLVPALFYASPPGNVPMVLAIGREWQAGSVFGPPLAYWLAEIAFSVAAGSIIGVYILSQICVIATYWAVFALGCAIVGANHAAIAVLLMVGVVAFAAPTVDFGPGVAAMPLTALALLHFWRGMEESRPRHWLCLGVALGLLLLATYGGLIVLALLAAFLVATGTGRARLSTAEPWAALVVVLLVVSPHLIWLQASGAPSSAAPAAALSAALLQFHFGDWMRLLAGLVINVAGVVTLVLVAGARLAHRRDEIPAIARAPIGERARTFVYFFALAPPLAGMAVGALLGRSQPVGGFAPLLVLAGLAVIVAAGDVIRLHRQKAFGWIWLALLAGPAMLVVVAILALPWTLAVELQVTEPAAAMGRFFTDSFHRRTGRPLAIVIGDGRLGGLVAMASPDRPSLFIDADPRRAPWVSEDDIRAKGAIVVWPLTDAAGTPPSAVRTRYPDLVPEVPRGFERSVHGRLPLLRVGWALLRPRAEDQGGSAGQR